MYSIGADEVGRGAFAGPVCAGSVIMPPDMEKAWKNNPKALPVVIRDSKKMTALQREKSAVWIMQNAISYAVGEGSVERVNSAGIIDATNFAFNSAINETTNSCNVHVNKLFIDAFKLPDSDYFSLDKQEAILHGEDHSIHIAAASIIAKVYRDSLMEKLSHEENNHVYQWQKNKGYGTKEHREAIKLYGICKHHRIQYVTSSFSRA